MGEMNETVYFKYFEGDWRERSAFQITCTSCRAPRFSSQNLHGGSQLSVTAVPEDLALYSISSMYKRCTYTHASKHSYT